jgi:hypothetical protein
MILGLWQSDSILMYSSYKVYLNEVDSHFGNLVWCAGPVLCTAPSPQEGRASPTAAHTPPWYALTSSHACAGQPTATALGPGSTSAAHAAWRSMPRAIRRCTRPLNSPLRGFGARCVQPLEQGI